MPFRTAETIASLLDRRTRNTCTIAVIDGHSFAVCKDFVAVDDLNFEIQLVSHISNTLTLEKNSPDIAIRGFRKTPNTLPSHQQTIRLRNRQFGKTFRESALWSCSHHKLRRQFFAES